MPDWKKEITERIVRLDLPADARQEVIAELASHFEDCENNSSDKNWDSSTLHVDTVNWRHLARAIDRAKQGKLSLNRRIKSLCLPAIAILFLAGLLLMLLDRAALLQRLIWITCMVIFLRAAASNANRLHPRTRSLWLPAMMNLTLTFGLFIILDGLNLDEPGIATAGHIAKAFRIPWLLPLPLLGALGALLAKRAHASRSERLIAGLAPSWVWLAVLVVIGLIFAFDRRDFAGAPLNYLPISLVGLVIFPALALLLGTLPFLGRADPVAAQQD
jgi:hypothetical protein